MLQVNVASKNPVKVEAVKETLLSYGMFSGATVSGLEVKSEVSAQPKTLEETVNGAINRAKNAFVECKYSFGIESGLMKVPHTKTGSMDVCVCAIYDGTEIHLGLSSAFEYPTAITKMIHEEGIESTEAAYRLGITTDKKLGSAGGIISLLTKGRLTRKDYTKQAVQMAIIHLENRELYPSA